jgi:hypothetical protein
MKNLCKASCTTYKTVAFVNDEVAIWTSAIGTVMTTTMKMRRNVDVGGNYGAKR